MTPVGHRFQFDMDFQCWDTLAQVPVPFRMELMNQFSVRCKVI